MIETKDVQTRHGLMTCYVGDEYVGRSLELYGEYSEGEVAFFRKVLRPGDVAIDVGANIGALTLPMAQLVGDGGKVFAFEPNRENFSLLIRNLLDHDPRYENVVAYEAAVSNCYGEKHVPKLSDLEHRNYGRVEINDTGKGMRVETRIIDSLNLPKCRLIKIDAEGHELEVIQGARLTIARCRPILYIENDRREKSQELIAELIGMGYWLWWHPTPLYNPDNFARNKRNVFGSIVSQMMIGAQEDSNVEVSGCDDVSDLRDDEFMFTREAARYSYAYERTHNLEHRLLAAHYWNLMQRNDVAATLIAANLAVSPNHSPTLGIKAMHDLQAGRWREGWKGYELRYTMRNKNTWGGERKFDCPKWNGRPTREPVLLWAEQGFGDSIMFARFIRWARMRAPEIVVEVPPELYELFMSSWVAGDRVYRARRRFGTTFSAHCSLPSLPAVLDVGTAGDVTMMRGPRLGGYLHADVGLIEHWREVRKPPKVGLCLTGSSRSERAYTRDCPAELFAPIAEKHGPFFNLQQDGQFESFADTAAAIEALDLVITVDTATAHLAGAVGTPTWLLLSFDPDWRWGMHGEHAPLWYPRMCVFQQQRFRDWAGVIAQVDEALTARARQEQDIQGALTRGLEQCFQN
jgi:FkbM family methyltransferase